MKMVRTDYYKALAVVVAIVAATAASLLLLLAPPAQARTTITVNTTQDEMNGDGDCSLREAITAANRDAPSGDCRAGSGADTIVFGVSGTITLGSSLPAIADPEGLTINGGNKRVTISGDDKVRVLQVSEAASLTLRNLTVARGFANRGGGVNNAGKLAVEGSTFSGNSIDEFSGFSGGGIANKGTLTVEDSTFSENISGDLEVGAGIYNYEGGRATVTDSAFLRNHALRGTGGGIYNGSGSTLTVEGSTFSENKASRGGGIANRDGTLTVKRSTFSKNRAIFGGGIDNNGGTTTVTDSTFSGNRVAGNSSSSSGGGIYNTDGTLTVEGSTFSRNHAQARGGGIQNFAMGDVTVRNSTFSENSAGREGGGINTWSFGRTTTTIINSTFSKNSAEEGGGIANENDGDSVTALRGAIVADSPQGGNCVGPISDRGYNIDDGTTCGFEEANSSQPSTDPKLDPNGLQKNGGPTKTIALLEGSPAIDAIPEGTNGCGTEIKTDQRGVSRPQGKKCDIGAFEKEQ